MFRKKNGNGIQKKIQKNGLRREQREKKSQSHSDRSMCQVYYFTFFYKTINVHITHTQNTEFYRNLGLLRPPRVFPKDLAKLRNHVESMAPAQLTLKELQKQYTEFLKSQNDVAEEIEDCTKDAEELATVCPRAYIIRRLSFEYGRYVYGTILCRLR